MLLACALAAAAPVFAQSKKPAKKAAAPAPAAPAALPRIHVAAESLFDRRTTASFPRSSLSVALAIEGEDATAVVSARARVTLAVDDTGRNLFEAGGQTVQGSDGWQQAGENGPPVTRIELASPSRKAKTLTAVEGVLEAYLPARDPAATLKIERALALKDKALVLPALTSLHVKLQILSKTGLENEKKQAEAKKAEARKKADAPKKKAKGKTEGLDEMAEALGETLVRTIEMLFMSAGENDLILKVDDPDKKIFSFDLAAPDGAPIRSYGTTALEGYQIVRMFKPIPDGASLLIRLRTPRSFGEVPFTLSNVKLP